MIDPRNKMHFVAFSSQYCKKCRRKEKGEMFVVPNQPVPAVDGSNAFPVVWFCPSNYHHVRRLGFNKPVDFVMNLGDVEPPKDGLPSLADGDEIWEEYMREVTRDKEKEMKEKTIMAM